jgi:riboflavin biosynthesis pyrimidine reductase
MPRPSADGPPCRPTVDGAPTTSDELQLGPVGNAILAPKKCAPSLRGPCSGDAADAVAELKRRPGNDLGIMGSGELIRSLMPRGLIDECLLMIHPLVLGSGDACSRTMALPTRFGSWTSTTTTTGVLIATYQSAP